MEESASGAYRKSEPARYPVEHSRSRKLIEDQKRVLALLGEGAPLGVVLDALTTSVEEQTGSGVIASILLPEDGARLRHGSAPGLPESYTSAIDGMIIGPSEGSCGTAAYSRTPVVVSDISTDPLWADYREIALGHGLRSCWSTPIMSSAGEVLGTFALYSDKSREPTAEERESIGLLSPLAALAIERTVTLAARDKFRAIAAEADSRLAGMIAQAPVAIAILRGPEHVFDVANAFYHELVGNRPLLGRKARDAFPEIGENYYQLLDKVYSSGEPAVLTEQPVPLDNAADGVVRDMHFNFVYQPLRDTSDIVYGIAVVASDVTESVAARRDAEALGAEFRTLAESIPQLAWMADAEGSIFWYNQRWYDYTGTTLEQMRGWGWKAVHHPDELERVVERVSRAFDAGESWEDTFPLRGKDGKYRWFLSRMHPIRDADGRVFRFFGTNTDITQQHEAADEKERYLALERASRAEAEKLRGDAEAARASAERANGAKSDFLAAMSHELRTPLNAIGGYVELMEMGLRGPLTTDQAADLERIRKSQQHLLGLINDVLDLAKIDSGSMRYAISDVAIAPVVHDVEEMMRGQLQSRGLIYSAEDCDLSLLVRGDPEKLRQILINLFGNAIKFTNPGGVISLGCEVHQEHVALRLRDTGVGIPADKLDAIFEKFVQVERRLNRPGPGAGLGLSISRDLARGMGGDLTVDSTPGEGSEFTLLLPRGFPSLQRIEI